MYDMIIVGAGPAGISAAVYAKSRGRDVVVLDENGVGGLIKNVSCITHYEGVLDQETGAEFAKRMQDQADRYNVEVVEEKVIDTKLDQPMKTVVTEQNTYTAPVVIIAAGGTKKKLGIPGEDNPGMYLNAPRDAKTYAGKDVYVIGGADGAVKEALYLSEFANKVYLVCIEPALACIAEFREKVADNDRIEVIAHSALTEVSGNEQVDTLTLTDLNDGSERIITYPGAGIFVYAGAIPNSPLFKGVKTDEAGYILTDESMETNLDGVYAIGDIRAKKVRQVVTAASDGAIAAISASLKN